MHGGHTSLASYQAGVLYSQTQVSRELIIITGSSGAGKTTWCRGAAYQARLNGMTVAGVLSPAIYEKGEKVGIALLDLGSGQRRVLATRGQPSSDECGCRWKFNQRTISWANQVLQKTDREDVVFIDELGPLELLSGQGFQEGMRVLTQKRFRFAYVVIRPSLLHIAREHWPEAQILDVEAIVK